MINEKKYPRDNWQMLSSFKYKALVTHSFYCIVWWWRIIRKSVGNVLTGSEVWEELIISPARRAADPEWVWALGVCPSSSSQLHQASIRKRGEKMGAKVKWKYKEGTEKDIDADARCCSAMSLLFHLHPTQLWDYITGWQNIIRTWHWQMTDCGGPTVFRSRDQPPPITHMGPLKTRTPEQK